MLFYYPFYFLATVHAAQQNWPENKKIKVAIPSLKYVLSKESGQRRNF